MSSGRASVLKRTTTSASKSKATAAPAAVTAAAAATRRLPRGSGSALAPTRTGLSNDAAATFIGCGSSSAPAPNPSGHINGMAAADLIHPQSLADDINCSPVHGRRGYPVAAGYSHGAVVMDSSLGGFGAVGSSQGRCGSISPISPPFGHHSSWDTTWDNNSHPPGGFMSLINSQTHLSQNSHFVGPHHYAPFKAPRSADVGGCFASMDAPQHNNGGSSCEEVEVLSDQQAVEVDSDNANVRTEKRIMWTPEEDEKLMSAWLKNSTDSSIGADRNNEHYWGDVVKSYNKTIPTHRKRNSKQAKDRWHKINRWTDLYECAYLKARRLLTSGYSDQMWIDAADKFYLVDNKKAKLGPFVLKNVWKICREVPKWKTYNEDLKNARKRKSYHTEGEVEENDDIEEMPERPIGQKAAKKAALAAKGKSKGSNLDDDGKSKESAIDVEKLDKFSKIQEDLNSNRIKILELQQKLSTEKLETTRLAHLTAKETTEAKRLEKESRMMHAYNTLISQDTSLMSDEEKVERVAAMKCFRKLYFLK